MLIKDIINPIPIFGNIINANDYILMNKLPKSKLFGQIFTPPLLAIEMAKLIATSNTFNKLKILDPCIGPSTFLKAFNNLTLPSETKYLGFDIDPEMISHSINTAKTTNIKTIMKEGDYLLEKSLVFQPNAIIMNPPYVRHEWINQVEKNKYKDIIRTLYKDTIDGRSNLFIYFLLKSFHELANNGVMCIIVYDAITSSIYGKKALQLVLKNANIEYQKHIKTPFNDALVDATIMLIRKQMGKPLLKKEKNHQPINLVPLKEIVDTRRGIGLINSKLFISNKHDPYFNESKLFLKKQPLDTLVVNHENVKQKAYLYEKPEVISIKLKRWLHNEASKICKQGKNSKTLEDKMQINDNWLLHKVHTAPILFNYYIRSNPRFLFNQDMLPFSDNFYGVYPKEIDNNVAWLLLNTSTFVEHILSNARNQGNGLKKLQLYEFNDALVPDWRLIRSKDQHKLQKLAQELLKTNSSKAILAEADALVQNIIKG